MDSQIFWIGLGNMGSGMCKNISEKANLSKPILIYDILDDRTQQIQKQLGAERTTITHSIAESTQKADIIFYSVPNDDAAQSVLNEILKVNLKNKIVVNCSTAFPATTATDSTAVEGQGGHFVTCPVFGGASTAASGQLLNILAGDKESVKRIIPFCKGVISRETIDLSGQDPKQGVLLKIVGNTIALNMAISLAEAHTLAVKTGLGESQLHQLVQTLFPGPCAAYSQMMVSGAYHQREKPLGPAVFAKKDAGYAQRLARECGMRLRMIDVAEHYVEEVLAQKGAQGEMAAVYGAARVEAGLAFEN